MDDMEQRVRAAADALISCHEALRKDPKDAAARGSTIEAVHEMRKITARIEIDLAISERDEKVAQPIPIPPHRSSRKAGGETGGDDNIGNVGNAADFDDPNDRQPMSNRSGGFRNNNSGPRSGGGGGGSNNGGPRRRMGMGGPNGGNNAPRGGGNDRPSEE